MDHITDIWGSRTPFDRGGAWPGRIDEHLADAAVGQLRWIKTKIKLAAPQVLGVA